MPREGLRLAPRLLGWFYSVFTVLFSTGAVWLALAYWGSNDGDLDSQAHPVQPWLLRLHGAAAMLALVLLGILLPVHISPGWKSSRNRFAGSQLIAVVAVLIITGYALYYGGNEDLRHWATRTHNVIGLSLPLVLFWHIYSGRRTRSRLKKNVAEKT